jgi:hypothetical protein
VKPTQAEVLLRIAENTYDDNDELMAEMRRRLAEGAQRILHDEELLMKAWEINQRDKARFAQYIPPEQRAGHAPAPTQGRAALGTTLAQQRAALGVIKDDGKDERTQQARTDRQSP